MKQWRRGLTLLAFGLLSLLPSDLRSEETGIDSTIRPVPGQITEIPFPALDGSLPIWIPEEHGEEKERLWPVLLYYHGTNGSPTLRFAMEAAGQENWILIGMSYRKRGRFSYRPETLESEMEVYEQLLETWNAKFSLRIDPHRVYVGGFSKGGWLSALFLEEDPRLKGGLVLGAGHLGRANFDLATKNLSEKSIFLGLGESDGNVAMSFRGKGIYESAGAKVTWEFWEGLGHSLPKKGTRSLQQWFRTEGQRTGSQAVKSDAIQWLDTEWARIEVLENKVKQWIAIEEMKSSPWYQFADQEILGEIRGWEEAWNRDETGDEERAAKERYFSILEAESKNRYVETLQKARENYHRLAEELPKTHWGVRAATARDRCAILLP